MAFDIPHSCTLPNAERPIRLAEFDTLLTEHATGTERVTPTQLRIELAGDEHLAASVRELAARESSCCSFFDFEVLSGPDAVTLGIHVPGEHSSILDSMQAKVVQRT